MASVRLLTTHHSTGLFNDGLTQKQNRAIIPFVIVLIFAIGATIIGILGMHQIGSFTSIGALESQILAFVGLSLLILGILLKTLHTYYCGKKKETSIGALETDQFPVKQTEATPFSEDFNDLPPIPYPPLAQLMAARRQISYLPDFANLAKPKNVAVPNDFPFLEVVKKGLPPPTIKYSVQREHQGILDNIVGYVREILNGNCPSLTAQGEGISHPSQFVLVMQFVEARVTQFNEHLEQKNAPLEHAHIDIFFKAFADLNRVMWIWHSLIKIAQHKELSAEDCEQLWICSYHLPDQDSDFYTAYPLIKNHLIPILNEISQLNMNKIDQEISNNSYHLFVSKLRASLTFPQTTEARLQVHRNAFVKSLLYSINDLFRGKEKTPLREADIVQIFDYLREEIEAFNKAIKPFGEKEVDIDYSIYNKVLQLHNIWSQAIEMVAFTGSIDIKIEWMSGIVNALPEKNSDLWILYPDIKEKIAAALNLLFADLFSQHPFLKHNMEDKKRLAALQEALGIMGDKLGATEPPKIMIDDEVIPTINIEDEIVAEQAHALSIQSMADAIKLMYSQYACFSHMQAMDIVHQCLMNQMASYAPKEREEIIFKICEALSVSWANELYIYCTT